jgi:hypothetical protein
VHRRREERNELRLVHFFAKKSAPQVEPKKEKLHQKKARPKKRAQNHTKKSGPKKKRPQKKAGTKDETKTPKKKKPSAAFSGRAGDFTFKDL